MTSHRVGDPTGRPLNFTFDGKRYTGIEGDTLASALLANGVRIMGRSFKYHRPRGPWGAWVDDPNAIMTVRKGGIELPNCQATTTYLEEGMEARAVNAWPSAAFDIKGGLDLFHRWLGAGFYYKTFMWPDWHLFEPAIRKMAGLGHVSDAVLEGYSADHGFDRCDDQNIAPIKSMIGAMFWSSVAVRPGSSLRAWHLRQATMCFWSRITRPSEAGRGCPKKSRARCPIFG
ncbi:MAG: 2Fe-2S iron-sulfur cluster-binding protein [Pseudomonadota bacterium]